jgi:hypothetical protein
MFKHFKKIGVAAFAFAVIGLSSVGVMPTHASPVDFSTSTTTGGTTTTTPLVLPFSVPDTLTTAVNFLSMYGEWILLALGVLFAPVLYSLAMKLVGAVRSKMAKA